MTINLKGDWLVVTFQYDPLVVERVKSISGRQFDPKAKHWKIPRENIVEAMDALEPMGFRVHIDVKNLYREALQGEAQMEMIRSTPGTYTGSLPLYDFQKIGASFLMSMNGALLADVPGLGKTIQTIAACEGAKRSLIVAPKSLLYSWVDELHKWDRDAKVYVSDGNQKERQSIYEEARADQERFYFVVGYETARIDIAELQKF